MSKRGLILISVMVVLAMIASAAWVGQMLPPDARLPIHWGIHGTPDGFAGKWIALFLPAAFAVPLILLFAFIDRLEPRREALASSQGLIRAIWLGTIGLMAVLHLMVLDAALHWGLGGTRLLAAALGLLFVAIGNQFGKSRRMYLIGIRTPWTLADEDIWIATHRLGGKLFVLAGLVWLAVAVIGVPGAYTFMVLLAVMLLAALVPTAYSYLLWRRAGRPGRN